MKAVEGMLAQGDQQGGFMRNDQTIMWAIPERVSLIGSCRYDDD